MGLNYLRIQTDTEILDNMTHIWKERIFCSLFSHVLRGQGPKQFQCFIGSNLSHYIILLLLSFWKQTLCVSRIRQRLSCVSERIAFDYDAMCVFHRTSIHNIYNIMAFIDFPPARPKRLLCSVDITNLIYYIQFIIIIIYSVIVYYIQ